MVKMRSIVPLCVFMGLLAQSAEAAPGVLLLAHGGSAEWNARVTELAARVDKSKPTEVALGMATRATIQGAIDRLVARGVTEIVAVPLFVSSWSTVITSTEYLLGQRADAPAALALFAKMSHGPSAAAHGPATAQDAHAAHASDGTTPVKSPVPIRMTAAFNDHPIVGEILASRARSISRNPRQEAVVLVAHGPNEEDDNRKWLADMKSLAAQVAKREPFVAVDYLTLRDDAPKPVRDKATADLRALVTQHAASNTRTLIVPLLVSFGGIDRGLRERLEGLAYTMPEAALVPDDRIVTWVLAMADAR